VSAWFPRITVHSLAIVLSILTYVLTTRAEHERRPPSIAIAWVLGLIAMPYIALPMYLLFGRRKLKRRTAPMPGICPDTKHWADHLIESFGLPAAAPALVRMHQDGVEARAALFELMSRAHERLDICTFILGDDAFGKEATAAMMACAARGVRVRFLLDGVCAIQLPTSWFASLRAAGVETAIFSPLLARKTAGPRNLRNHRKWAVADATILWAGGRNLAAVYFCGDQGVPPWLDLSFDLKGPVAASVAAQFEADWAAAGGDPAGSIGILAGDASRDGRSADGQAAHNYPAGGTAEGRAQFLPSGPDQTEDTVYALLVDACFHATQRILAVTPYFLPDAVLEAGLRLAARRGVKIDLVIPSRSNHRLADFARNRSLRSLADAGVSIHLLNTMNHAKAVVFDRSVALCGSPNLDSRSLLLNYESAVVFYGTQEIEWLAQWIEHLFPDAHPFDHRAPGLWRDLCEGLLLTIAYQL
jgi:cardiolipin synthase